MKSFKHFMTEQKKATPNHVMELEKILHRDHGSVIKALELGTNNGNLHIGQINTGKGKGLGKAPMNAILSYADYNGLTLTLDPDGSEESQTYRKLSSVYNGYGFKENDGAIDSTAKMYRKPEKFKLR